VKIAVIGAKGQLGVDLCTAHREAGDDVVELDVDTIDVALAGATREILTEAGPDLIVNAAALTDVDGCEDRVVEALSVNALGARNVALCAGEIGAHLVYISTDYVFDGSKGAPYTETDAPNPLGVYAISKLAGEHFCLAALEDCLVLRTCGLYGKHRCVGKGRNFVDAMLEQARQDRPIKVVSDEFVGPTSTVALARQMVVLSRDRVPGICHASANGSCSWYEFACEIFRLAGLRVDLSPVSRKEFPTRARRPAYSVLENAVLTAQGLDRLGTWQEELAEYLAC